MNNIILCFFLGFFIACDGHPSNNFTESSNHKRENPRVKDLSNLLSGKYGDLSIAIKNGDTLTGVYEFYNAWNDHYKDFMQKNVFYINGIVESDTIKVNAGWPGSDQKLVGQIVVHYENQKAVSLNLLLSEMPDQYASEYFTKGQGYYAKYLQGENWSEIRLVRNKTRLFSEQDSNKIRKGYLVERDIVKVLSSGNNGWLKIEYNGINLKSATVAWIRATII